MRDVDQRRHARCLTVVAPALGGQGPSFNARDPNRISLLPRQLVSQEDRSVLQPLHIPQEKVAAPRRTHGNEVLDEIRFIDRLEERLPSPDDRGKDLDEHLIHEIFS